MNEEQKDHLLNHLKKQWPFVREDDFFHGEKHPWHDVVPEGLQELWPILSEKERLIVIMISDEFLKVTDSFQVSLR